MSIKQKYGPAKVKAAFNSNVPTTFKLSRWEHFKIIPSEKNNIFLNDAEYMHCMQNYYMLDKAIVSFSL